MRRLLSLAFFCLFALSIKAQVITKDSLSVIRPGTSINFVLDFSKATIMGMDEIGFTNYEKDWTSDKPSIVNNFQKGINNILSQFLVFVQNKNADYTLTVSVLNVTTKGYMLCDAVLKDKTGKKYFEVQRFDGGNEPPFMIGTKLAKMKAWAKLTGWALGGIIKTCYTGN